MEVKGLIQVRNKNPGTRQTKEGSTQRVGLKRYLICRTEVSNPNSKPSVFFFPFRLY